MRESPATIWYGVQGEGRGHATRSRVLVDLLRREGVRVRVLTGGDALDVFRGEPGLVEIPLLRFAFRLGGKLDPATTLLRNIPNLAAIFARRGAARETLRRLAERETPDLVVSDFEPLCGLFARERAIPWISVDHQHVLTDTVLPRLGTARDLELRFLAACTEFLVPSPRRIVSSFHHFERREGSQARLVGCFLREEILSQRVADRGHVCVYLKEGSLLPLLLRILGALPHRRFHLWCPASATPPENVRLAPPHPARFAEDLAGASWLLTTAGNQLLGEAMALGKPVLAFPVPGQTEQALNAHALGASGCGEALRLEQLNPSTLEAFATRCGDYRRRIASRSDSGLDGARESLEAILPSRLRLKAA